MKYLLKRSVTKTVVAGVISALVLFCSPGAETAGLGCLGWKRTGTTGPGGSFKKFNCINLPLDVETQTEVTYESGVDTSFVAGASHPSIQAGRVIENFQSKKLKLRKL